jgi:hypothetical protein
MSYAPDTRRYDVASFSLLGRSGIVMRPISAVLWQDFGDAFLSAFKHLDQFQKGPG